jgi:RNA polymerase sigma-70 factor, ECF subfamily
MSLPKTHASSLDLPAPVTLSGDSRSDLAERQRDVLQLFDETTAGLRRYVASFGLPSPAIDDIVQEAFLALFRHLGLGRSRSNLKGWLYRVAHNLALKQRARARRWREPTDVEAAEVGRRRDPADDPEARLVAGEYRARLRAVARALPERDRRCLYLRAEGLGYRDIAAVLGVSLGSVAKSLGRAFARLARVESR